MADFYETVFMQITVETSIAQIPNFEVLEYNEASDSVFVSN
jgi:hypothetical protein